MRYYVLVTSHAYEYPEVNDPEVFTDRVLAVDAWRKEVLDAAGYPDDPDSVDPETIVDVGQAADEFLLDVEKKTVGWIVNNDCSVEEMAHVQLFAVEAACPQN